MCVLRLQIQCWCSHLFSEWAKVFLLLSRLTSGEDSLQMFWFITPSCHLGSLSFCRNLVQVDLLGSESFTLFRPPCLNHEDRSPSLVAYVWPQTVAHVVPDYLAGSVQYLLRDQLSFTVEDFGRVTVRCIGRLLCMQSWNGIVLIFVKIPWAELVLSWSVHHSAAVHLV